MNPAWRVTASRPSYSMMLAAAAAAAAAAARQRHVRAPASVCSNYLHSSEVARGDICLLPEISKQLSTFYTAL